MADVSALLLCAGIGTRLRPLTDVLPKCLMPINGRPLLEYWLRLLRGAGIDDILVNVHHHEELVRTYLADHPLGTNVTTVHEPKLLGTGGTLLHNRRFFGDRPVLLAHGDNLTSFDVHELLQAHRTRPTGSEITMMTFHTSDPRSCGIVETTTNRMVTAFHEKVPDPPGNLANAAVYVVEPSVIAFLDSLERKIIDFSTEVLPAYVGRMSVFHNAAYHRDIGTIDSLLTAQFDYPLARIAEDKDADRDPWATILCRSEGALSTRFLAVLARAMSGSPAHAEPHQ